LRINGARARQVGASGGIFGVIGALLAFLWCAPPPRDSTLVCDHSLHADSDALDSGSRPAVLSCRARSIAYPSAHSAEASDAGMVGSCAPPRRVWVSSSAWVLRLPAVSSSTPHAVTCSAQGQRGLDHDVLRPARPAKPCSERVGNAACGARAGRRAIRTRTASCCATWPASWR